MNWQINVSSKAVKALAKINKKDREKIWYFIKQKLPTLAHPRLIGKSLQGNLKNMWRYRVGDYRLICEIKDQQVVILIVDIGHRKEIYH
jgi:mRNA interferase RelE/StbE